MTKKRLLLFASLPLAIAMIVGVLAMLPPRLGVTKANFGEELQKEFEWRQVFDEDAQQEITKSSDLTADLDRMWRTVPGVGQASSEFEVSPVSAINAASRVFATVDLEGKTVAEITQVLSVQPRPNYGYDFPFYSAEKGALVYRFDCGSFGWEFNVIFDGDGKVSKVERHGIE